MDLVLLPLLRSADESEREQLLSDLILFEAAPLVRNTLRQRLGFYVSHLGANPHNHDAEDLYHDVMAQPPLSLDDEGELSASCLTPSVLRGQGWQHCTGHGSPVHLRYRTRLRDTG